VEIDSSHEVDIMVEQSVKRRQTAEAASAQKSKKKSRQENGDGENSVKGDSDKSWREALKPGTILVGRIDRHEDPAEIATSSQLKLRVLPKHFARLSLTEVEDVEDWKSQPFKDLYPGQFLRCIVLRQVENSRDGDVVDISIRPSLLDQASTSDQSTAAQIADQELSLASEYPQPGELVKGFVETVNKVGVFVRIKRGILAIVPLKHLADRFIKDAAKEFPIGKLVAGRVLAADSSKRKVVLSLRATSVLGKDPDAINIEDLKENTAMRGQISSVTDFGVFVRLDGTARLSGLVHKSQMADGKILANFDKLFSKGDKVKVVVISVDAEKKRIGLSLKPSVLANAEGADSDDEDNSDSDSDSDAEMENVGDDTEKILKRFEDDSSDDDEDDDDEDDDEDAEPEKEDGEASSDEDEEEDEEEESGEDDEADDDEEDEEDEDEDGPLSLADAIQQTQDGAKEWAVAAKSSSTLEDDDDSEEEEDEDEDSSDEDSDGDETTAQKKERKKAKRAEAKRKAHERAMEEAKLSALEQAKLEEEGVPQSVDDFERLLMGSPNSSMLWIQYMAFQTAQVELDQARAVAERALRTINYRMEKEKQNVLLALLRIECKHGSNKTVEACIKQILERMDKDVAYLEIAKVFEENEDLDKADDALRKAVKAAHGSSEAPWLRRMELKFKANEPSAAQELLKNAQRNVEKQVRPKLYLGYARLEFSMAASGGKSERARTILEGLIDENPKRNDLWLQYIDLEIKYGNDPARVRNLFERAVASKFSIKKTKTFFKRWLLFETDHGTEEDADKVKAKARDYVASVTEQE